MCGRVYMAPADPELRELVREMNRSVLASRFGKKEGIPLQPEGEIFPSSVLPVLAVNKAGEQRVFPMKWGFSGPKGLLINARAETAAEKATFREAWKAHRCVIPASWYFEWEHDEKKKAGQKYALRPEEQGLIWLAGLYRMEEGLPVFVVLTRPADESIAWMHDRMPVMLPRSGIGEWIRPESDPDYALKTCVTRVRWERAG
ncbi:MAG: SOS response-associated peptidase [Clostridiales bacterium]|nr:SOS response-associated peptidase [Clostridiales bacterium]